MKLAVEVYLRKANGATCGCRQPGTPPQYTLMPIQIAKDPYLLGCGPLYCLRSEMMGCATSLAIEIDLSALGFGELCVERVILELKALDLLGSAAAYEQPGAVDGRCHECTG